MSIAEHATVALLAALLLAGCADASPPADDSLVAAEEAARASENEQVVLSFVEAWSRLDPSELASYFTADGVYHNMPSQPVQGREAVEALIRGFTASWTDTEWDVRTIMSEGNVVMIERVDRTVAGDRSVDLPCVGVFEIEDGKIKVWRDYFDLGTYMSLLG